jgi:hypothetical protein
MDILSNYYIWSRRDRQAIGGKGEEGVLFLGLGNDFLSLGV